MPWIRMLVLLSAAWIGTMVAVDPARAAAPEELPPYFVGEVVVNEEAPEGTVDPSSVRVIDAEEIRALGSTTVAEAVAHLPGVSVSVGSRNEQRVWLGGYEPASVLVLLDGVPIADPYSGEVDLGQIPVGDVAKIVVSSGGVSSLYGPDALGGVINIVTFEGAGTSSMGAEIKLTEDSTVLAHASGGGRVGDVDWYLGLARERSDGWPLADDFVPTEFQPAGRRLNSDFARWSLLGRLGRRFSLGGRLSATLRFIDAEKGIPFHTERPRGFVRFARFPEWRQGTLAVGWESQLGDAGGVRAQLFGHSFDNALDVFTGPELDQRSLRSTFEDRVLGGYVVADRTWGAHGVSAALHLREDRHRRIEATDLEAAHTTERYSARTGSLVVQDEVTVSHALGVVVGGALDHHAVHELWQLEGSPADTSSSTRFSPQAELRSLLGPRLGGGVSVYRRTRFPTLQQLYGSDVPNPGLRPQRSTGASAQLSWHPSDAHELRTRVYFDRVDDLISRLGRGYPYENQDQAELAGAELSARGEWGAITARAAGSLQRARFTASVSGLAELPYVPEATLEAGVGFALGTTASVGVDWSWVGARVWYDGTEQRELEPYQLLRLAVTYELRAVELRVELDNLFDESIEQEWGYPLPGRRLWVVASTRF